MIMSFLQFVIRKEISTGTKPFLSLSCLVHRLLKILVGEDAGWHKMANLMIEGVDTSSDWNQEDVQGCLQQDAEHPEGRSQLGEAEPDGDAAGEAGHSHHPLA